MAQFLPHMLFDVVRVRPLTPPSPQIFHERFPALDFLDMVFVICQPEKRCHNSGGDNGSDKNDPVEGSIIAYPEGSI